MPTLRPDHIYVNLSSVARVEAGPIGSASVDNGIGTTPVALSAEDGLSPNCTLGQQASGNVLRRVAIPPVGDPEPIEVQLSASAEAGGVASDARAQVGVCLTVKKFSAEITSDIEDSYSLQVYGITQNLPALCVRDSDGSMTVETVVRFTPFTVPDSWYGKFYLGGLFTANIQGPWNNVSYNWSGLATSASTNDSTYCGVSDVLVCSSDDARRDYLAMLYRRTKKEKLNLQMSVPGQDPQTGSNVVETAKYTVVGHGESELLSKADIVAHIIVHSEWAQPELVILPGQKANPVYAYPILKGWYISHFNINGDGAVTGLSLVPNGASIGVGLAREVVTNSIGLPVESPPDKCTKSAVISFGSRFTAKEAVYNQHGYVDTIHRAVKTTEGFAHMEVHAKSTEDFVLPGPAEVW
jgi:hypothetical protein